MKPDHHRAFFIVAGGSPNADAQAVFVWNAVVPGKHPGLFVIRPASARPLRTDIAVLHGTADAGPGGRLRRRQEARFSGGARSVRNSLEGINSVAGVTAHFARGGFHDCLILVADK